MSNSLKDLNDHLFAQIDRLANPDLTPEQIEQEAQRAKAMVGVSDQILGTGNLMLTAARLFAEHGDRVLPMLPQIGKADE